MKLYPRKNNYILYFILLMIWNISKIKAEEVKEKENLPNTRFYGFVKVDVNYANKALLTFGNETLLAPTTVKRQVSAGDKSPRWGISPSNTRLGFEHSFSKEAKGVVEIDFIDFSMAQGNVNVRPRLRQAYLTYEPDVNYGFFAGQKWDIFGPVGPHTFNPISKFFQTGDIGWQREQVGIWGRWSQVTFTIAGGTVGKNATSNPTLGIDQNSTPTLAAQVKWEPSEKIDVYVSALTVDMKFRQPLIDSNRDGNYLEWDIQKVNDAVQTYPLAYQLGGDGTTQLKSGGYTFGFIYKPIEKLEIKSEFVYGSNLSDINSLGISRAQFRTYAQSFSQSRIGYLQSNDSFLNQVLNSSMPVYYSIVEEGGWLTFNYTFSENWKGGLQGGGAKVVNQKDLGGATESNLFVSQAAGTSWTSNSIVGAIRENMQVGYRVSYHPRKELTFFLQNDFKKTIYKNQERYEGISAHIKSYNLSTGILTLRNPSYSYLKSQAVANAISVRAGVIYNF